MPPKYASFRNEKPSPKFSHLPGDNEIVYRYHYTADGFAYGPRKHWCLLAEIVEVVIFGRVVLETKDKTSKRFKIAFYTDDRGFGWKTPDVKPGTLLPYYTRTDTCSWT